MASSQGDQMTLNRFGRIFWGWWTILLGWIVCAAITPAIAQVNHPLKTNSVDEARPVSTTKQPVSFANMFWKRTRIVPLLLYSPETSVMFGAGTLTLIDLEGANPDRPSSVSVFGMYTLNQQVALIAGHELRGAKDRHVFQQTFRFIDWPDQFYGIGNHRENGIKIEDGDGSRNYIKLTDRYLQFESEYQHQPVQNLYIGLGHHWRHSDTPGIEAGAATYGFSAMRGVGKITWSGLRPSLAYDSRDRLLWPSSGFLIRGDATIYRNHLGSDFDAELYRFDARAYVQLFKHQVLALRTVFQRATGQVPFQRLPALGGSDLFRGWYLGRLRDRALNCNQLESRHEIDPKMAVIGFAALARVAPTLSALSPGGYHIAGGAGFRYALNQAQRAHLRFDLAYGDSVEFYFQFKEAF
jgi:hypothetical protein